MAGRKQRSRIEKIRTKAWITRVMFRAGFKTQYQFEQVWDQRSLALPSEEQRSAPRLDRLKDGEEMSPSAETLAAVERYFPGTRHVYDTGPGQYPLWEVLEGSVERAGALLRRHITAFDHLSHQPPLTIYAETVFSVYFSESLAGVDFVQWYTGKERNVITELLAPHIVTLEHPLGDNACAGFSVDDMVVILAAHRVCLFVGVMPPLSTYCLYGAVKVLYQLLLPWGIAQQTIDYINDMKDGWHESPLQS